MQQVLAYETDLLEYPDLFEGSVVVEEKTGVAGGRCPRGASTGVQAMGGAFAAVESGYMKTAPRGGPRRPARPRRVRRGRRGRGQHVHRHRAEPAAGATSTPRSRSSTRTSSRRPRIAVPRLARRAATRRAPRPPATVLAEAAAGTGRPDARLPGVRPRRRHRGGVGRDPARGVRRVPGAHGRRPECRAGGRQRGPRPSCATRSGAPASRSAAATCASWSASRASTGTPTVPSRSRSAPATPASRSSTRASG